MGRALPHHMVVATIRQVAQVAQMGSILGPLGTIMSNGMAKLFRIAGGVFLAAAMVASAAQADGPDISAQRLLESWKDDEPGMRMIAEVIASAFASGFSWGGDGAGERAYCAPPDLKGRQIMNAFDMFLRDNPTMADQPYGAAMAGTLKKAFPCSGQGT